MKEFEKFRKDYSKDLETEDCRKYRRYQNDELSAILVLVVVRQKDSSVSVMSKVRVQSRLSGLL